MGSGASEDSDAERASGLPKEPTSVSPVATDKEAPRVSSRQLFAGRTELHIEHRGILYRLKQTSLGKLILTK